MEKTFTIFATAFICCLICVFAYLALLRTLNRKKSITSGAFIIAAIIAGVAAYLSNNFFDFIRPYTLNSYLFPLVAFSCLAPITLFIKTDWFRIPTTIVIIYGTLLLFPEYSLSFSDELPRESNLFLTGLVWLLISFSFRIFSPLPYISSVAQITFFSGVLLLSVIGGAPALTGLFSLCFLITSAALLITDTSPNTNTENNIFDIPGFFCGWLSIIVSSEKSYPCVIILWIFVFYELLWAWAKKITFLTPYASASHNTICYQAISSGLSRQDLVAYLVRNSILLLIFCGLEVFAPNNHSIPLLCALLILWNQYRLYNWETPEKTLKETNEEVFKRLKKSAAFLKDNFTRKE